MATIPTEVQFGVTGVPINVSRTETPNSLQLIEENSQRIETEERPSPLRISSPLQGIGLDQLESMVNNQYNPPLQGSDDPHQGVDFAEVLLYESGQIAIEGRPVQSVLEGVVAGVIRDRFPYGNAVIIETPVDRFPQAWLSMLDITNSNRPLETTITLTCPEGTNTITFDSPGRSFYLLYAHMGSISEQVVFGTPIGCGDGIGTIGNTGNSLNPHLHLEVRTGPPGAIFESMAHYDPSASLNEMDMYCTWRVRGIFNTMNPMDLLLINQP